MSDLFGNLPAELGRKQPSSQTEVSVPPNKRPRTEAGSLNDAQDAKRLRAGQDPVMQALAKLTSHISSSKKFNKAFELLRQLISEDRIRSEHSRLVFEVVKASMREPKNAEDPQLRREYFKLFKQLTKISDIFTPREQSQLDVYGTWGARRNELHTDDSFAFNKTIKGIKDSIQHLEDATEEQDLALQAVKARLPEEPQLPEVDTVASSEAEQPEADPFGLDALVVPEQPRKLKFAKKSTWSHDEIVGMKREALLDCFDTMKACYGHAWARTSVDLAIEDLAQHRAKFCSSQQPRIDDLVQFVKQQRSKRKQGAAAASRQSQRDSTAFETARKEWGRATISARGKVGAGGDHQAETWLG